MEKLKSTTLLAYACVAQLFVAPAVFRAADETLPLMPWPSHVASGSGQLVIDGNFTAGLSGGGAADLRVRHATARALDRLFRETGIPVSRDLASAGTTPTLSVVVEHVRPGIQQYGDDESYRLTVTSEAAKLTAAEPLGALRGLETFLQLVRIGPNGFAAPAVDITDKPRFAWRGLSLDVSRHFMPVSTVERTIDGLAAVKMNVLHWHLSDDQGFRVESKLYPLLQGKGSNGLYYTREEVHDVIAYARDRGIRIVPEFDMPGHATSWFTGYPDLASGKGPYEVVRDYGVLTATMDPAKEYTYKFLDGFIGEMARLFPDDYFHIGGDEVNPKGEWANNSHIAAFMKQNHLPDLHALQAYFNRRVAKIVTRHGKRMEGWDEILDPDLPRSIVIQSWRGQKSLAEAARQGYSGILSSGYYLDLMYPASQHYAADPMKGATADLTPAEQKRILGGEATMWEELATLENIDVKLWPRLAAIAERLWSPEDITDVPSMYRRLAKTSYWLEFQGIQHRSQLRRMQKRLAGNRPVEPLASLAALLEPIKGYSRHSARTYSILTPYNRLVDAIAPESDASREFRDAVDRFLATPSRDASSVESLRRRLTEWQSNIPRALPILQSNGLLT
ncbi:MAG: beta-N-acetylhexosaminidase, partial [Bryobacteraceae bacterium]